MERLKELIEDLGKARYFDQVISGGSAELAIMEEGIGTTPLSAIFAEERYTESVRNGLCIYQLDLIRQIREIMDEVEKELLHHPGLPEYEYQLADPKLGVPKNDHRRCRSCSDEDDGR